LKPALLPAVLHLSGAARTTRTKPVSLQGYAPAVQCRFFLFLSSVRKPEWSGLKIKSGELS
jgi:hypothetical protein